MTLVNLISKKFFKRVYRKLTGVSYNVSYSQTGEDLIIDLVIDAKKWKEFTYLDIGANDPVLFNNTYKFYEKGYSGVCVEPDPHLHALLSKKRKRDTCLNVGVAAKPAEGVDFYIMDQPELNTFSAEEAAALVKNASGTLNLVKVVRIPLRTVETIIDEHFNGKAPVFVNLDVEGLDEEILQHFPFDRYRPALFCIETVHYTEDASSEKRQEIFQLMEANGYEPFADTYINTIFIDKQLNKKKG
ncbi:MAG: FkbM family methyltransferase [Chitinophagaceae bacterium]